jgi:hypothetical protein
MQASKIKPGFIYAIEEDNDLRRFRVESVNTKRTKSTGSPHDYTSEVEGYVVVQDSEKGKPVSRTLHPDRILGEYKDYTELVAREAAEKAERQAIADARKALAKRLFDTLYRLINLEQGEPDRYGEVKGPIRLGYDGKDITIQFDAVEPLLKALEAIKESA